MIASLALGISLVSSVICVGLAIVFWAIHRHEQRQLVTQRNAIQAELDQLTKERDCLRIVLNSAIGFGYRCEQLLADPQGYRSIESNGACSLIPVRSIDSVRETKPPFCALLDRIDCRDWYGFRQVCAALCPDELKWPE